ncbi:rhamnogalacturonan acetylesterase [Paenibacillus sp. S150]|uniref:rhamnogalacturonan acetylesterase n=1 Tax=Paenibacillus sp. S150 TaxID=2749826 RepID=UPI001C6182D3|nr:rhamnogalacturonan acetylesterase [Paenibacillus sp. S150]MBW4084002.1 rhamnogalacturonan acetylesterase [Paenibacillus sp. S150]
MRSYCFDFGLQAAAPGYAKVTPDSLYTAEQGFGFAPGSSVFGRSRGGADTLQSDFCIPQKARFLADVPDGMYRVTVLAGDPLADTSTVIKAGNWKAVLEPLNVPAGQTLRESFSLRISGGQLSLSFSGLAPRINALEIQEDSEALAVVLAGDSTVTDQGEEGYPYAGWGQMLPLFFRSGAAVDNRALSGRSTRSFIDEGHLQRISNDLRERDYLFIQFGHNDSKPDEARHTEPYTTYKEHLLAMITAARDAGANPVLVTSMHRRRFDGEGLIVDTHGDYLTAMRELAADEQVPLIDLEAKSRRLFEAYGPEGSKELFMWSYPGEYLCHPAGVQDNTHFQIQGARLLAELVVLGIREAGLNDLIIHLRHGE